jgi:hypothetical protein
VLVCGEANRGQDCPPRARMPRSIMLASIRLTALLIVGMLLAPAAAVEPLVGRWLLKSQQVSGQETASRPLTLEIRAMGEALEFEYSVPLNASKAVSLRFVAHLDGSASEVKDAQGRKIGTARILRGNALEYSLILEGPNRPTASGKLKLSMDRMTLLCDSDSVAPGGAKTHTVQIFARQ